MLNSGCHVPWRPGVCASCTKTPPVHPSWTPPYDTPGSVGVLCAICTKGGGGLPPCPHVTLATLTSFERLQALRTKCCIHWIVVVDSKPFCTLVVNR